MIMRLILLFSLFGVIAASCHHDSSDSVDYDCDSAPISTGSCNDADVTHDIPFQYTLTSDYIAIDVGDAVLRTFIGPWGAHTQPHTGHDDGDKKANWSGFYATSYSELTELEGDGDTICQKGEICGVPEGLISSYQAEYAAPDSGMKIHTVQLESVDTGGDTYISNYQWKIEGNLCRYNYTFYHIAKVSSDLRDKMLAAGYTDPWTITSVTSNLITGEPIVLDRGETIGFPHIIAREVPGHPGYYSGSGAFLQTPWAQIEFITNRSFHNTEPFYFNDFCPLYLWLTSDQQDALRHILYNDASNPGSFRYDHEGLHDWLWKSEMDLWTAPGYNYNFNSLYSRLGSWWEDNRSGCVPRSILCDEMFSIFPILKSSDFYDPVLYDSADVSYLAHYSQADSVLGPGYKLHWKWGEVIEPVSPDSISGSMVIKWRIDHTVIAANYQAISYRVAPELEQLKIRWGSIAADRASVLVPPVPDESESCDGVNLSCFTSQHWWFQ